MEILGLEKVSLVDYEGYICATVFTGGCNFLCPFCHNPEIVKHEVSKLDSKEVLNYIESRKGLLDAVTISGGEPTLQPDLEDFIRAVKGMGLKVKLDTNGTRPEVLKNLIDKKLLDYVAMDIKNSFNNYSLITGVKNPQVDKIKESLRILETSSVPYELRTTLVNEFHSESDIKSLSEDLKGAKTLYLQKFVDSGYTIQGGLTEIKKSKVLEFKNILSQTIKNVHLRGY